MVRRTSTLLSPSKNRGARVAATGLLAGRYRIVKEIARGGMGIVHEAFDESRKTKVALKAMHADALQTPRLIALFQHEYQTLANLAHPRIIRVHEYGISELGPYYTMELLEGGGDLQDGAPMPWRDACAALRDVATSLALLHARGLVHRDVTPRNVHKGADGRCKLLDFGALATFGKPKDLIGTAPFVPPEALHAEALDGRSDLYSLGALAYWILTRTDAFPAHEFEDLLALWKVRPAPPSSFQGDIPPELDQLVLALLSPDPLARPAHASAVIERLTSIARLPQDSSDDLFAVAKAYLTNVKLVGRESSLARVDAALDAAAQKDPQRVLIVGESGLGRTRLLSEAALRAQLRGAITLRAEALPTHPFATAYVLASALLDTAPKQAREAAGSDRRLLASLGAEFAARLEVEDEGSGALGARQWADQIYEALRGWFSRIAREHHVVFAVDNLERADEASLQLLSALAGRGAESKVALFGTYDATNSAALAPGLKALQQTSDTLTLEPLLADDTAALLDSVFGDARNLVRCSEWIHSATAGRPLHIIEFVNTLLSSGDVRLVDGAWMLPAERPSLALSDSLAQALSRRLESLSASARAVAEALSLVEVPLTFELCAKLAERADVSAFTVLEELVNNRVLALEGKLCRFANEAIRKVLATGMNEQSARLRNKDIGELLLRMADDDVFSLLQAGRHLMDGGELTRGADCVYDVVANTNLELGDNNLTAPIIARACEVYEAEGRSVYETFPMLSGLMSATFYADWHWAQRWGARALTVCEDVLSIRLARRLERWVGTKCAIIVALIATSLRFLLFRPKSVRYPLARLFDNAVGALAALSGAAAAVFDRALVDRCASLLRTLAWLGERSALDGAYGLCGALALTLRDDAAAASSALEALVARFGDKTCFKELDDDARRLYWGGSLYALGVYQTMRADDRLLGTAEKLEGTGVALHRMFAQQLRLAYHHGRGELALADRYRKHVEQHASHVGSAWQAEIWEAAQEIILYTRSNDVVNAKRVADLLGELAREIPSLDQYARQSRAALHVTRGEYTEARAIYEEVLRAHAPRSFAGWSAVVASYASCFNGTGDYARAKVEAQRVVDAIAGTRFLEEVPYQALWAHIELAIAEAGQGNTVAASKRIDDLLASGVAGNNPFLCGSLHYTRTVISYTAVEPLAFEKHLAETERCYAATENPALAAQSDQLRLLARKAPWAKPNLRVVAIRGLLARLSTQQDRNKRAEAVLEALLKLSKVKRGMLFKMDGESVQLVAQIGTVDAPPAPVLSRIRALTADLDEGTATDTISPEAGGEGSLRAAVAGYRVWPLMTTDCGQLRFFGAVALADEPELDPPSIVELATITRGLTSEQEDVANDVDRAAQSA